MTIEKNRVRWDAPNDKAIAEAVRHARIPLYISDPNLPDNPIVFANDAFLELTGYDANEVFGRNCRFLQGPDTTKHSVASIKCDIARQEVETIELVNYRKDGTSFINALQIGPILDNDDNILFYFGSQLDVTAKRDAEHKARKLADQELTHRLRNIVNIMTVIIRMSVKDEKDVSAYSTLISERLRALGEAHFRTINLPEEQNLSVDALADNILSAYSPMGQEHFHLKGEKIVVPTRLISCIALVLHELATNSVKHGAFSAEEGVIDLAWEILDEAGHDMLAIKWREMNGPEVERSDRASGSKIIDNLINAVGGDIHFDWQKSGLLVDARFPL